uniref:Odorant receptor n=1 Tax=Heliconius melpomene rosina TaxID=171916 RepID=A0A1S5XXN9_HELME|nr:olfactory receptor 49 [Heliconius melpomene rosina]
MMYEYDTFVTFDRILSFAGIPIFAKHKCNSKKWLLFQIFNFFLAFLTFVFTSGFVLSNLSNLELCIQGACVWTTGVIMFISLGVCLVFRLQFRSFLEEIIFNDSLLEMPFINGVLQLKFGNGKLGELKKSVINSRETLFRLTRVLLKTYIASLGVCATLYLCGPIYLMCIRNDKSLRLLAFDMWFPWGLENFAVYVASFVFHAYVGYLCCIAFAGLQSTLVLLVGQIIRQLKILTFILSNMDDLIKELVGERGDKWQRECTTLLTQCVDHFVKTKRFANRLNAICQPFYLSVILVAMMLMAVCSVKIAISDKLSPDTVKYYIHEICNILIVLMLCSLGQQVENECEQLEMAVTDKWYIYNSKHRVCVRIFKMALSQRMPIYIFGSITLSLPTFTWFIRTGMSFFTLVMSVLEE